LHQNCNSGFFTGTNGVRIALDVSFIT